MTASTSDPSSRSGSNADKAVRGYVDRLRQWRTRPEPDLSLNFLSKQFKQQVEKPHKQLGQIASPWIKLIPAEIQQRTRLESLVRGVLKVGVADSSTLYQLDRLLKSGLEVELIRQSGRASLSRIQLHLSPPSP